QWVMRYTEGKENRTYSPKPGVYQMKSRKTTYEERLEIVEYVIKHQLSYKNAAEKFKVSYNNVYSWTQKYKQFGPIALEDNRGKKKASEAQTGEAQLKAEIEALRVRNQWLEMEVETLKKQEQMERELIKQESAKKRRTKRSKRKNINIRLSIFARCWGFPERAIINGSIENLHSMKIEINH